MKRFVMVVMSFVVLVHSTYAVALTDVQEHWAKESVGYLVELGIVDGFEDGTFKPEDTIQVDAFIKMVVTSLGHTLENGSFYWASTFIDKAKELGLVKEGEFATYERPITRAEMACMIVRALQEEYPDNLDEYKSLITDYDTIADIYQDYIVKAYAKGIITGYQDGSFKPEQNATRAEAAAMIVRMIDGEQRKVPELTQPGDEKQEEAQEDFIEPVIKVKHNDDPWRYHYFELYIDNYKDYTEEYQHLIQCVSHPELDVREMPDPGFVFHRQELAQWRPFVYTDIRWFGNLYKLTQSYYATRENTKNLKITDGMALEFKLTIKKGDNLTKEYSIPVKVKMLNFKGLEE